jgi:pyruvate/2-oxoglutarate dehydrogenase complex dihydrolipoamide acyltransferase (E2) component
VARVLRMPGVATDAREGVLSSWLIDETDAFDAAQTIAYVETSTLLLSVEAGRPGVLLKTLVEPGSHVDAGTPLGVIAERDENLPDLDTLLHELGVDAAPHATHRADPGPAPATSWFQPKPEDAGVGHEEPLPALHARKPRLTHDHFRVTVRAEPLVETCAQAGLPGGPLAIEYLVVKAVAAAHSQLPELNLTQRSDGVRREATVDVGLAVRDAEGLVVPVLRDVGTLSLLDIALLATDFAGEARAGRLVADDRVGSIVVTTLGRHAIDDAIPRVVPPQVAALAISGVRREAVVEGDGLVAGSVLRLTLSIDPDLIGDVVASRWLAVVAALLERPAWMLG